MTIRVIGRYALHREIASGGMATVHLGRLLGPVGFSRTVAVKCLHPQFARDPEFVSMFLDEARLAARIRHPNVVPTLDVVAQGGEIFLVMEYVQGESLASLGRAMRARGASIPLRVAAAILVGSLHGLHAAHEATDERGAPLELVHRDVSPQNILVGVDGIPRILDFGIARAAGRLATTRDGHLKGKLAYMAPEQLHGEAATRRSDVFGAAVVLWEILAGERLFHGESEAAVMERVLFGELPPLSRHRSDAPPELEALLARGLARKAADRFATAREMAVELERILGVASATEIATWVETIASESLASRAAAVTEVEASSITPVTDAPDPPPRPTLAEEDHPPTRKIAAPPRRAPRWPWVVGAGALAAGIAAFAATRPRPAPPTPVPIATVEPPPAPSSAPATPTSTAPSAAPVVSAPPPPPTRPARTGTRPARPRTPLDGLPPDRE